MATTNDTNSRQRAAHHRARSDVSQWAQHLPEAFLLCRDLGHQWGPYRGWHDRRQREYVQVLMCGRCRAERIRHLDYSGRRVSQSYAYPDDYLAPAGSGVLTADGRADLRLVSLMRLIDETDELPDELAARRRPTPRAS